MSFVYSKIFIYQVKNLNTLEGQTEIPIQSSFATLQFVDNLILLHDFDKEKTSVYDLKMKNRHFLFYPPLPITNYNLLISNNQRIHRIISSKIIISNNQGNESDKEEDDDYCISLNINYLKESPFIPMTKYSHNTFVYDKELLIKGDKLEEINNDSRLLYYIYFDPLLFYNNYYYKHFNDQNQISCMGRRAKTNEVMVQALIDMIERFDSIQLIKDVLVQIIHRLFKVYKTKEANKLNFEKKNQSDNSNEDNTQSKAILISNYLRNNAPNKPTIITQSDVYSAFIKCFEHRSNIKPIYMITLLIYISKGLSTMNIPLHHDFLSTIRVFIKKIPLSSLKLLFQMRPIPDDTQLALYLIEYPTEEKELFQIGIDMLHRLNQYEEILLIMIKRERIHELLLFLRTNSIIVTDKALTLLKIQLKSYNNRSIIKQFLSN